ncbi:MAG: GNAT family N-acetyltransferase [Anaerolineales bacterium]
MSELPILHNPALSRFELTLEGQTAVLEYTQEGEKIIFTHTEVPAELGGRGLGGALARAGLEFARAEGKKVVPLCSFVAGYLAKHPEYADLTD